MDSLQELLDVIAKHHLAQDNFRGLLHALIGRKIWHSGKVISSGLTWRELSALLRRVRWDIEAVREIGLDPESLPPRDREKFWYSAIARANIDSDEASKLADQLADKLKKHGYEVVVAGSKTAK